MDFSLIFNLLIALTKSRRIATNHSFLHKDFRYKTTQKNRKNTVFTVKNIFAKNYAFLQKCYSTPKNMQTKSIKKRKIGKNKKGGGIKWVKG